MTRLWIRFSDYLDSLESLGCNILLNRTSVNETPPFVYNRETTFSLIMGRTTVSTSKREITYHYPFNFS